MEKIIINIDSKYRDTSLYPESSKFSIKLNEPIKNISDINISSIEFTNLYYSFSTLKNNISFKFTIISTSSSYELKIINGFYSIIDLINTIQTELNAIVPGIITIICNPISNKVTISSLQSLNIYFTNNSVYPSLGFYLGFRKNEYLLVSNITSESIINTSIDNYLFLKINDYGFIYANLINNEKYMLYPYNFLGKIITDKQNNVFDNNNFITKKYIFRKPVNISKFDIELFDPYGNTVNMLLSDFSFTLELNYIYNFDT